MQNPAQTEIGWVIDTLTSFGIGIIIGHRWAQFQLRHPNKSEEETRIAWLETVAIQLGLLMLETLGIRQGKTLIVWNENTMTEGTIRKRRSKDCSVNEEWKVIQAMLIKLQTDIEAKRVKSNKNIANGLSRGKQGNHKWRHVVAIGIPLDLDPYMFQVLS
jgi:hypothetical protein